MEVSHISDEQLHSKKEVRLQRKKKTMSKVQKKVYLGSDQQLNQRHSREEKGKGRTQKGRLTQQNFFMIIVHRDCIEGKNYRKEKIHHFVKGVITPPISLACLNMNLPSLVAVPWSTNGLH